MFKTFFFILNITIFSFTSVSANLCHEFLKQDQLNEIFASREAFNVEFKMESKQTSTTSSWIREMERVQAFKSLLEKKIDIKAVKTMLYPSIGYDGSLGFLLFPNLKVLVGIDWFPFWTQESGDIKPSFEFLTKQNNSWAMFGGSQLSELNLGSQFLGSLLLRFPNAEIKGMRFFSEPEKKDYGINKTKSTGLHAIIRFNLNDGFGDRFYIHIESNTELLKALSKSGQRIDVVLSKGAMDFFTGRTSGKDFYELFLPMLTVNLSTIIDSDGNLRTGRSIKDVIMNDYPSTNLTSDVVLESLGYDSKTELIRLKIEDLDIQ